MIFTKEQIDEIRSRLSLSGAKDTSFPDADIPLKGNETIAIIQGGENKKVSLTDFYQELVPGTRGDFFNVSSYVRRYGGNPLMTFEEALANVPYDLRKGGQVIGFFDSDNEDLFTIAKFDYSGDVITDSNWNKIANWVKIYSDPTVVTDAFIDGDALNITKRINDEETDIPLTIPYSKTVKAESIDGVIPPEICTIVENNNVLSGYNGIENVHIYKRKASSKTETDYTNTDTTSLSYNIFPDQARDINGYNSNGLDYVGAQSDFVVFDVKEGLAATHLTASVKLSSSKQKVGLILFDPNKSDINNICENTEDYNKDGKPYNTFGYYMIHNLDKYICTFSQSSTNTLSIDQEINIPAGTYYFGVFCQGSESFSKTIQSLSITVSQSSVQKETCEIVSNNIVQTGFISVKDIHIYQRQATTAQGTDWYNRDIDTMAYNYFPDEARDVDGYVTQDNVGKKSDFIKFDIDYKSKITHVYAKFTSESLKSNVGIVICDPNNPNLANKNLPSNPDYNTDGKGYKIFYKYLMANPSEQIYSHYSQSTSEMVLDVDVDLPSGTYYLGTIYKDGENYDKTVESVVITTESVVIPPMPTEGSKRVAFVEETAEEGKTDIKYSNGLFYNEKTKTLYGSTFNAQAIEGVKAISFKESCFATDEDIDNLFNN